jgi:coiled-coil and C2 domain-containing protein 2A
MRRCKKTQEVVFWDAVTGRPYLQTDNFCPLQKIKCLVSTNNIYRNVEPSKVPFLLDFDVSNVRKWVPLPINEGHVMLTLQEERMHFTLPDHHRAREMQIDVIESIQRSIREWRHISTCFRPDISSRIASKLEQLETAKMNGRLASNPQMTFSEGVTQPRGTLFGFVLHEPFTSVQDILDRVKVTEIHRNGNPRVEYAVAARAFGYPGGIISMWVCVCSL